MQIMYSGGIEKPQFLHYNLKWGQREYTLSYKITENTPQPEGMQLEESQTYYSWIETKLPLGKPTYDDIVARIVKTKYSDDEMTALINNHLLDDGDEGHIAEWKEMQEWRAYAKKIAKEAVEQIDKEYEEYAKQISGENVQTSKTQE